MIHEQMIRRLLGDAYPLTVLPTTTSTNDIAKQLARSGAPHGSAVLACSQSQGRGRLGRSFLSPEGGIYLSVLLRPAGKAEALRHLTLLFAEAAVRAVCACSDAQPTIKWPNDLLLGGKKLAGILTEGALAQDGTFAWLICGIGLNLDRIPDGVADIAAALPNIDGDALAAALIRNITDACDHALDEQTPRLEAVRMRCTSLGRLVEIRDGGTPYRACAEALLPDGALLVRTESGEARSVFTGEILVT